MRSFYSDELISNIKHQGKYASFSLTGYPLLIFDRWKNVWRNRLRTADESFTKVSEEDFAELTASDDIIPAPYLARYKWVLEEKSTRFKKKEWEKYILHSYELVKEKLSAKLRKSPG
ncbi:MAG: hypothetical protein ABIQ40_17425 [Bacteroidia bacterium]